MTTSVATPADLLDLTGRDLGTTDWVEVAATRIREFTCSLALDVEPPEPAAPAAAPSYLVLSLANLLLPQLLTVQRFSMGVNVGLDAVSFGEPVFAGSGIRGRGQVISADEIKGGVQVVVRITIDVDGHDQPACVADTVSRFLP